MDACEITGVQSHFCCFNSLGISFCIKAIRDLLDAYPSNAQLVTRAIPSRRFLQTRSRSIQSSLREGNTQSIAVCLCYEFGPAGKSTGSDSIVWPVGIVLLLNKGTLFAEAFYLARAE